MCRAQVRQPGNCYTHNPVQERRGSTGWSSKKACRKRSKDGEEKIKQTFKWEA